MVPFRELLTSHDVSISANASHDQKSWCPSFWFSWANECNGATYDAVGITCCQCQCQRCHMRKSHVAPHFNHLGLMNMMVPFRRPSASNDVNWHQWQITGTTGMTKNPFYTLFDCLDLTNAVEPFRTPSVSYDTDVSTNGVTWPKSLVAAYFDPLDLTNAVVPLTSPDTDTGCNLKTTFIVSVC